MNIDYGHYERLGCWASGEAICLLIGINPADYANLLEAQLASRDPDDIDFLCSYSKVHTEQLQQDKALTLMRKNKITEIQALMWPIEHAMERDLLTGKITPLVTKDGTTYFAPVAFVTWAASKGFEIPLELSKLEQAKAPAVEIVNQPGGKRTRRTNLIKAIESAASTFSEKPSFEELWQFFQDDKDSTSYIVDFSDEKLTWRDTKGKLHDVIKNTVQNHLSRIKR